MELSNRESGATQEDLVSRIRNGAAVRLNTQKERATDGLGGVVNAMRQGTADEVVSSVRENLVPVALMGVGVAWWLASRRRSQNGSSQTIRRTGRTTQRQLQRMVNENALLVSAGALLLGVAFGLAVPETERENTLMGEARDAMIERAQQMAGNAATAIEEKAVNAAMDPAGDMAGSLLAGQRR